MGGESPKPNQKIRQNIHDVVAVVVRCFSVVVSDKLFFYCGFLIGTSLIWLERDHNTMKLRQPTALILHFETFVQKYNVKGKAEIYQPACQKL